MQILSRFILFCWLVALSSLAQAQTPEPTSSSQLAVQRLTLAEAVNRARENHPLLVAARQRIVMAEGERLEAGLRPNPTFSISGENFPVAPTEVGFDFGRSLDWFAIFSQTFETGGKRNLRLALAERGVESAQAEVAALERQIVYEVKAAYQKAAAARERLELVRESLNYLRQLVRLNEVRVSAGYAAEGDLIKTRLEAQRVEYAQRQATLDYDQARIALLRAMGRASFVLDFELAERLDYHPVLINATALEQAALRQPQVQLAEARLARAQAALRLEQARARPDITASFGYKRHGPDNALYGAVSLPLPLYSRNRGYIARAEAEVRASEAELQQARNLVLAELAAARRAVEVHQQQVEALRTDFLMRADESQAIALAAYREGATNLIVLLEAQRARSQAQELYFQALYDYQLAVHELERAAAIERLPRRETTQVAPTSAER